MRQVSAQFVLYRKIHLEKKSVLLHIFQLASLPDNQLNIPSIDEFISLVQNKLTTKKETGVEVRLHSSTILYTIFSRLGCEKCSYRSCTQLYCLSLYTKRQ
jgi:hypothetical protein